MPVTPTQAAASSRNAPFDLWTPDDSKVDTFLEHFLKFVPIPNGDGWSSERVAEGDLGTASFVGAGATMTDETTTPTVPATRFDFKRIAVDAYMDDYVDRIYSSPSDVDQAQTQIDLLIYNMRRTIGDLAINGDGTGDDPTGVNSLLTAGNTVGAANNAANGGALLLTDIDRGINKITANKGNPSVLVMNRTILQKWLALNYAVGQPSVGMDPWSRTLCYMHGKTPIAISDWVKSNQTKGSGTNLSSIYILTLGYKDGFFLGYKPGRTGKAIEVESVMSPTVDRHIYRASMTLFYGLRIDGALAAVNGIQTT